MQCSEHLGPEDETHALVHALVGEENGGGERDSLKTGEKKAEEVE